MLAFIYILLATVFGIVFLWANIDIKRIIQKITDVSKIKSKLSDGDIDILSILFAVFAGSTFGIMIVPFLNYYLIYLLDVIKYNNAINYDIGTSLTVLFFLVMTTINIKKIKKTKKFVSIKNMKKKSIIYYSLSVLFIVLVSGFLMFYTYNIKENTLYIGASTFSDLSPHTAMISSFAQKGNIPTTYMHFGNDGIRWHFLFYFFAGILNYLGFGIDFAINIPSLMVMASCIGIVRNFSQYYFKEKACFFYCNYTNSF